MSKQSKWQRARLLANPDYPLADERRIVEDGYKLNILSPISRQPLICSRQDVELLSEFADSVPLIPWEQFLADCQRTKEGADA